MELWRQLPALGAWTGELRRVLVPSIPFWVQKCIQESDYGGLSMLTLVICSHQKSGWWSGAKDRQGGESLRHESGQGRKRSEHYSFAPHSSKSWLGNFVSVLSCKKCPPSLWWHWGNSIKVPLSCCRSKISPIKTITGEKSTTRGHKDARTLRCKTICHRRDRKKWV